MSDDPWDHGWEEGFSAGQQSILAMLREPSEPSLKLMRHMMWEKKDDEAIVGTLIVLADAIEAKIKE